MAKNIFTLVLLVVSLLVVIKIKSFVKNNAPEISPTPSPTVTVTPIDTVAKMTVALNEQFLVGTSTAMIAAVIEDSRCPQGVQCIQAGRVRVNMIVNTSNGSSTVEIEPGKTVLVDSYAVTLDSVEPYPSASSQILPTEYRFVLGIHMSQ